MSSAQVATNRDPKMAFNKAIDLIFYRMREPSFVPKGNGDVQQSFNVPDDYFDDRFKELKAILAKNKKQKETTKDITPSAKQIGLKASPPPNLKYVLDILKRTDSFSLFIPMHRKIAVRLVDFFRKIKSLDSLLAIAVYVRDRINPFLFSFTFATALLTRPDTNDVLLPTVAELFPDRFLHSEIFHEALEELAVVPDDSRVKIFSHLNGFHSKNGIVQCRSVIYH